MLTLLEGGFHSKAHKELINRIKALVDEGKRCYLFVPEQQTLSAESETCEVLPPSAPRCFEVTNFTRFANTAFRQLGGIGGKYCTGAESSLIMWRVLSEHKDELTMCGGRKSLAAGTVERALGAVRELETHGISSFDISELLRSGRINDARLVAKLEDLFIIYSYYKRYVSDSYNNLAEDAEELAKRLEAQPEFLKDTHIFIDGFISFTEPQYRLLGVMMKCTDLTVTLTLPKAHRRAFEYSEVVCTEKRLKEIARSEDVDVPISLEDDFDLDCSYETCPARSETAKGCPRLLGYIADLLFETSGKIDNDCLQEIKKQGGRVRVFKAHTPFEECDFVASDIKRRMIESRGAESYSSFAIIARNADKYVGIIDESLRRAGIPYFISKKRDITSFEAIKLISIAYQIVNRGFRREDVLTYAKCGLAGISHDECDEFELYTITWNIDGGRFVDGVEWRMNPRGYERLTEDDHLKLLSIAQTREKIIEPLKAFAEAARAALTVREQATALFAFLSSIGLERALYERAQEMFSLGELDAAEENARLWKTVCSSLDTLVDVLGDKTADAEEFIGLLNVLFNEAAISVLPLSVDQVTVGSADTLRIGEKRHVYLIGVNAGEFPQNVTDLSYFNERDKATLKALNLPLEPELEIKNARELYCFTRAFLSARETVTLLYTELGAAMDALLPSDVIFRLESISTEKYTDEYGEQKRVHIRPVSITDEIRAIDRIYSPDDALLLSNELTDEEYRDVKAALGTVDKANIVAIAEMNPVNNSAWLDKDAIALLYGKNIYMSQSRLDKFLSCPFSYYASYILGLNEDGVSEISASLMGNFIHTVLENFFRTVFSEENPDGTRREPLSIAELTNEDKEKMTDEASRQYISEILGDGFGETRQQNAIARLRRAAKPIVDCLCNEFLNCKYKPIFFEVATYGDERVKPDPLVIPLDESTKIHISGKIDRVDALKVNGDVYVRVIDYKSGSKDFKPDDLKRGENLQMFLYLKSIVDTKNPKFLTKMGVEKGGSLIPAGVLYVKTSLYDKPMDSPFGDDLAFVTNEVNEQQGMLLESEVSIGAMSESHLPNGIRDKKNKLTYTSDEWDELCSEMEERVRERVRRMRSGDIKAEPQVKGSSSPCDYCRFKPVCRSPKIKRG